MVDADLEWKWGDGRIDALVPDVEIRDDDSDGEQAQRLLGTTAIKRRRSLRGRRGGMDTDDDSDYFSANGPSSPYWTAVSEAEEVENFSDEKLFGIKAARWLHGKGVVDPIEASREEVDRTYVMLKDLTQPLALSDLLGDFQRAGQIMLSRIDDLQVICLVETYNFSFVLVFKPLKILRFDSRSGKHVEFPTSYLLTYLFTFKDSKHFHRIFNILQNVEHFQ